MNNLIDTILEFKELLIISIVAGGLFFVIFSMHAGNITWKSRSIRIFGVFMGLDVKDMLWLSVGAIRIIFIICVCTFSQRLGLAPTAFYAVLFLLSVITFFGFPRVLIEVINSVAVYASLTALGILLGYFRDVDNNPMLLVIYVLLSVFTVLYSTYFYMRGISDIVKIKLGVDDWKLAKK